MCTLWSLVFDKQTRRSIPFSIRAKLKRTTNYFNLIKVCDHDMDLIRGTHVQLLGQFTFFLDINSYPKHTGLWMLIVVCFMLNFVDITVCILYEPAFRLLLCICVIVDGCAKSIKQANFQLSRIRSQKTSLYICIQWRTILLLPFLSYRHTSMRKKWMCDISKFPVCRHNGNVIFLPSKACCTWECCIQCYIY